MANYTDKERLEELDRKIAEYPYWGAALAAMDEERRAIKARMAAAPDTIAVPVDVVERSAQRARRDIIRSDMLGFHSEADAAVLSALLKEKANG